MIEVHVHISINLRTTHLALYLHSILWEAILIHLWTWWWWQSPRKEDGWMYEQSLCCVEWIPFPPLQQQAIYPSLDGCELDGQIEEWHGPLMHSGWHRRAIIFRTHSLEEQITISVPSLRRLVNHAVHNAVMGSFGRVSRVNRNNSTIVQLTVLTCARVRHRCQRFVRFQRATSTPVINKHRREGRLHQVHLCAHLDTQRVGFYTYW